ncbi:hypothetical protein Poly30_30200 [Planctomycetes bacterium Poly30]|uniref:Uncharacterized protein n=1 Tax=Saltatorellus ferox TaxID=2528018 RepID=A0A518ETT3_9BACT|nr:hypothetical protein Poly30_30200 [Planctomycetes bacterium Poly30]
MLALPQRELWTAYLELEALGQREEALGTLRAFLESMKELDESAREAWALDRARAIVDAGDPQPLRLPLFVEVLFPALVRGVEAGTPGCARWTASLLHLVRGRQERHFLPKEARTEAGLLRLALELDPSDGAARLQLIQELSAALEYATHEAPDTVLWDQDAVTTKAQCDELLAELVEMERHMGIAGVAELQEKNLVDLAEFCRFHLTSYRAFLGQREGKESYRQFLDRAEPESAT